MTRHSAIYRTEFLLDKHKIFKRKTQKVSLNTYNDNINLLLLVAKNYFGFK